MSGKIFRELAEDLSAHFSPSIMFTGHTDSLKADTLESLKIIPAPKYKRNNNISRIISWVHYFCFVFIKSLFLPKNSLMFLVSNPPFLGLLGFFFKKVFGQKYVILVYDIYPDILIRFGKLSERGLLSKLWRKINKMVYENSEIVYTIGEKMAGNLEKSFDSSRTSSSQVISIHNWADIDWIKPLAKKENYFAQKYQQGEKITVMYSGNLGDTHDVETVLNGTLKLCYNELVHFMFIGDGSKWPLISAFKEEHKLENITILPFQPEAVLPYSLSTGDISIILLDKGSEGLMVPSKTYPAMAAGSALLAVCSELCEVASIILEHDCGFVIKPGDINNFVDKIKQLSKDKALLKHFQKNSRKAVIANYSRKNTDKYFKTIMRYIKK